MSAALESLIPLCPTADAGWFGSLRTEALATFEELGLPTRRLEEWKGTNFAPLAAMHFARVGPGPISVEATSDAHELVFVDGRFDSEASRRSNLPAGIRALSLAEALDDEPELLAGKLGQLPDLKRQSLVALQTAFFEDGALIVIDEGVRTSRPLRIRFVSTAANTSDSAETTTAASAAFPRLLVIAGRNSAATLLQEHVSIGAAPGFTALVAEFHLSEGAEIESVQIQSEGAERIHFASVHARLERNAQFHSHVFSLGNGLVRSELEVQLAEPGAETKLFGLYIGRDKGHIDHFTTIDHAAEQCTSDQEYRGVLADHSKGVFRGRVIVRPGAQKTDTCQSNLNLLLSDHANIDTKPQLEIYANDIRASHGSTIGQLDSDALFFLRARGISAAEARLLLTGAFAHSIVDQIADDELRQNVGAQVNSALHSLEHGVLETGDSSEEVASR